MKRLLTFSLLLHAAAHADVLNPVHRFFGIGGQFPDETNINQRVESPYDLAPFSPSDSDLGVQEILTPYDGKSPVLVSLSAAIYRTDNAPTGISTLGESSWVSSNGITASWRPRLIAGWFGDFGVGQEFVRFDRTSALDYENFLVRIGTIKSFPDLDDLVFFTRLEYQRLTTGSLDDGDYNSQRIRLGLDKALWSSPRHLVSAGISSAFDLTASPNLLERNDLTLVLSYRYAFTDTLFALTTVQGSVFDYDNAGRKDDYFSIAAQLMWQFKTDAHAHLSIHYDRNQSDSPFGANDFQSFSGGIGAGFTFRF